MEKSKIKVGVMRGGISSEYEISLQSGGNALALLRGEKLKDKYDTSDILVDREGLFHLNGIPVSLEKLARSVDVVLNSLHGEFGEDGKIQQILEGWNIPYTGSGPLASALGYNKVLAKEQFQKLNIKTPRHILIPPYQKDFDGEVEEYARRKAREVFSKLSPAWIIKPLTGGAAIGIHFCKTLPELARAFLDVAEQAVPVIVEEMILGKKSTIEVIEGFRGKNLYTLLPIGNFSSEEKKELERLAILIHQTLGLSHYSRTDFIVVPNRGIYALEVNTLPGLTDESLLPQSLSAVGSSMPEFLDHLLMLALQRK